MTVKPERNGDWTADYTRRDFDGSEPSRFVTKLVRTDGTVAMENGRRVR